MDKAGKLPDSGRRLPTARGMGCYASAVSLSGMRLKHNARHPPGGRQRRFSAGDRAPCRGRARPNARPQRPVRQIAAGDELLLVQTEEEGLRLLALDRRLTGVVVATHELE